MIKYYAAAAISVGLSAPAYAQECLPLQESILNLAGNGFQITFGDVSSDMKYFIAEDGSGRWVFFVITDDALCPIAGGQYGVYVPLKPNA